eukprot:scaffold29954_cov55-Prasinocladus_malaysianus.AAC.1
MPLCFLRQALTAYSDSEKQCIRIRGRRIVIQMVNKSINHRAYVQEVARCREHQLIVNYPCSMQYEFNMMCMMMQGA